MGPPDLVVEVANSSSSYDLHQKKNAYRRNGVREYVVYQVRERRVRWSEHRHGDLVECEADADGPFRSRVFPGLWLNPTAMVEGDTGAGLDTLEAGLASPEHADYVASYSAAK